MLSLFDSIVIAAAAVCQFWVQHVSAKYAIGHSTNIADTPLAPFPAPPTTKTKQSTYIHARTHTHAHTRARTHTHTHAHTQTRVCCPNCCLLPFRSCCPQNGIVVWEETLGPSVKLHDLLSPYWMKYQVQAVNEMISASINHPSVIFHAFYNEGAVSCIG